MAKIESVSLKSIPETINVGDEISDIIVVTKIKFHQLDFNLSMEYLLHLFVYDIHGSVDVPIIINNWDDSNVIGVKEDAKDDFLGKKTVTIHASDDIIKTFETPMTLKLGNLNGSHSYYKRKLEVLATITPAIGRASKWSEPFETNLVF
ncbi:hypothetical protein L3X39_08340 [Sabulilitoribacter multivorans]|uniref:Uncharacterized protein n=1 Tax=Flaviramulus multivorans TaxID=1304750 RepID=A0ABS9IJ75_9FLAO|nr:hypothetical protein [Flaviramulus multivorans]MCF7560645.1 hypothetical protein [Flaviramulus multivorans]